MFTYHDKVVQAMYATNILLEVLSPIQEAIKMDTLFKIYTILIDQVILRPLCRNYVERNRLVSSQTQYAELHLVI